MKLVFLLHFLCTLNTWGASVGIPKEMEKKFQDTTYRVSPPWQLVEKKDYHQLTIPEDDLTLVLMILPAIGKPEDLLLKAWKKIQPDFNYSIELKNTPPAAAGWEEIHKIDYKVPIQKSRVLVGQYSVLKGKAYILLIDGSIAGLDKRGAQLSLVAGSWNPQGLVAERLGDKDAIKLGKREFHELETFLKQAMRELQVPGAQVAIVQDGQVVWHRNFGVTALGQSRRVEDQTLFMIGSTTKPLTTLLQARLVDQKKISWDDPVNKHLPLFKLADAEVTQKVLIRHTACACTGMPRRDLDFFFNIQNMGAEERITQMQKLAPTTGFGETFQYSNSLVAAGGYAAAKALYSQLNLQTAYEKAMREEVFLPLGMTHSRVKPKADDTLAAPHSMSVKGRMGPISQKIEDALYAVSPAGAVWSNALDLTRYVQFELSNGELEGKRLLSQEGVLTRREPGVKVDETARYGLGLFFDEVKGLLTWGHGGNTLGFTSDLVFIPEKKIGWVLLTNAGGSPLRNLFQQKVLEVSFGSEKMASKRLSHIAGKIKEGYAKVREQITTRPKDMTWVQELVGVWHSEDLGKAVISQNGKDYQIDFGDWKTQIGTLVDKHSTPTLVSLSAPFVGMVALQKQADGSLLLDAGQIKYRFTRK